VNILDVARMSVEGLSERRFRFALNLLGILIGCAAITGLIALTQGMSVEINSQLGSLGTQTITVLPNAQMGMGGGSSMGGGSTRNTVVLDWRTVNVIEKISGVREVSPVSSGGAINYQVRGSTYYASVTGVTESYFKVNEALEVSRGRTLIRSDSASAVIGSSIANPLGSEQSVLKIGDRIKVTANVRRVQKEMTLRIIGVIKESGTVFQSSDSMILIPIRTYEQFFETGSVYSSIQVMVASPDAVEDVAEAIKENIRGVTALTAAAAMEMVGSIIGTINAVLGGIAGISLLVAGVGIINTMTVSVLERTKEIGTMKAIGAKSGDVLMLFLSEAVMTGIIGGALGAVAGFGLSHLVAGYVGISSAPSVDLGALIVGFAVVTCVVSGLYPAWRASKLNPVEALRHE